MNYEIRCIYVNLSGCVISSIHNVTKATSLNHTVGAAHVAHTPTTTASNNFPFNQVDYILNRFENWIVFDSNFFSMYFIYSYTNWIHILNSLLQFSKRQLTEHVSCHIIWLNDIYLLAIIRFDGVLYGERMSLSITVLLWVGTYALC